MLQNLTPETAEGLQAFRAERAADLRAAADLRVRLQAYTMICDMQEVR